jgi:hypothetical protein
MGALAFLEMTANEFAFCLSPFQPVHQMEDEDRNFNLYGANIKTMARRSGLRLPGRTRSKDGLLTNNSSEVSSCPSAVESDSHGCSLWPW